MRISSYLIATSIPGQPFHLLMHGYSGAVDKVPDHLGAWLLERRGESCDPTNGALAAIPKPDQERLRSRGYLTDLSHDEERALVVRVATTLHDRILREAATGFMFVPTYYCNLRCPYCFQPHQMHSGRGRFAAILQPAQVDHAFAIIDEMARPGGYARALGLIENGNGPAVARGLDFGLFGGEPLCTETLSVVSYILDAATRRDCTLSAITNGVELHRFADLLGPRLIRELQITLDGTAQLHNKRRIGPGLHNTFDAITDNIDLALARGTSVSVRINADQSNIRELAALDTVFAQRGWKRNPLFSANAAAVTPEGAHEELIDRAALTRETTRLRQEAGSDITSYERYASETLARCLSGEGYPFQRVVNCSSESGLLMFDPLSDVYSCWEDIGKTEFRVGTYDANGLAFIPEIARQWLMRFPVSIEQCTSCPYALVHASGCAKHARDRTGTLFASDCDAFQQLFPRSLGDAYADAEQAILATTTKIVAPRPELV